MIHDPKHLAIALTALGVRSQLRDYSYHCLEQTNERSLMNFCANIESKCNTSILDSEKFCVKHKYPKKRRGNKKSHKKDNAGLFDASGKVRANMGLWRLKAQDRARWEKEQKARALCLRGFLVILTMVSDELQLSQRQAFALRAS